MALETGTFISDLNALNPLHTDDLSQADGHLRLIKSTIQATFPNMKTALNASSDGLNYLLPSAGVVQVGVRAAGAVTGTGGLLTLVGSDGSDVYMTNDLGSITLKTEGGSGLNLDATKGIIYLTGTVPDLIIGGTALSTTLASYAPLAGAALTGTPTAPSPLATDNSSRIATSASAIGAMVLGTGLAITTGSNELPGGLVVKYGSSTSGTNGTDNVNFAVVFPHTCVAVILTPNGVGSTGTNWAAGNPTTHGVSAKATTGFSTQTMRYSGTAWATFSGIGYDWVAIGY